MAVGVGDLGLVNLLTVTLRHLRLCIRHSLQCMH